MKNVSKFLVALIILFAFNAGYAQDKPATGQGAAKPASPLQPPVAPKKEEDCGCESKVPTDTAAIVNGVKILIKDVDEPQSEKIKELQNQVVEARKRQVYLLVNAKLLDAEAKKRGISSDKLLELEVMSKVTDPTTFINMAIGSINADKADEAIATLDKVNKAFPTRPDVFYYRARAYIKGKKMAEAKADLEKFVAMAPPDARELADAKKLLEQLKDIK